MIHLVKTLNFVCCIKFRFLKKVINLQKVQNIFHKLFYISNIICKIVNTKMNNKTIFAKSMFMVVLCMHHYFITSSPPVSAEDIHRLLFTPGRAGHCDILVMMVTRHPWHSAMSYHTIQTTVTQLLFSFASFY